MPNNESYICSIPPEALMKVEVHMLTDRHHEAAETARFMLDQLLVESNPEARRTYFRAARKLLNRDPMERMPHDRD